eukprot:TRINITY_DN1590_c0_g1_i2.p1 TRINITY_DN1590_c0_g1~~TRINITY_DN1590_c0_g1_i2.p1  ORF type:complete len:228 (+),score=30.40 TRINITY_DN1590_c0_g1_i2:80-763(+)
MSQLVLDEKWISAQDEETFRELTRPCRGLFESVPVNMSATLDRGFKIAVLGMTGTGKTTLISSLCGLPIPARYTATNGTQILSGAWPIPLTTGKLHRIFFDLWEHGTGRDGESQLVVTPELRNEAHAQLYVCSATDAQSLLPLQNQLALDLAEDPQHRIVRALVLTKHDQWTRRHISEGDVQQVATKYNLPYFVVSQGGANELRAWARPDIRALLNYVCLRLIEVHV